MATNWARFRCTSIPLDTPLARLVTADPGTKMIEHDLMRLHKPERVELHTCGRGRRLGIEGYGASSGGGRHDNAGRSAHQEEVWTRSSQQEPARSNIHTSTTASRQKRWFYIAHHEVSDVGSLNTDVQLSFSRPSRLFPGDQRFRHFARFHRNLLQALDKPPARGPGRRLRLPHHRHR